MSNKKQTSVEWYEIEINSLIKNYESQEISKREFITVKHNIFYQAKEMEKQQIIDAFDKGISNGKENDYFILTSYGEQYYNETFKK
jgi:hypothetical protein